MCKAADEGSDPSPQERNSAEEQDVQDPVSACLDGEPAFPGAQRKWDLFTPVLRVLLVQFLVWDSGAGGHQSQTGCERHLRSSGVAVLGADRCPSVHDKSLLSTALFPLTTKEKMEADQRSIYVGNVSGSPWHCSVPSWVCPKSLVWGPPVPHKAWLLPFQVFLLCPAWERDSLSATCSSPVADVSSPKSPLEAVGCEVLLVPSKQGRLSVGFVFQVGALSWEGPLTLSRG